jgi:hypothetical protein
LRSLYDLQPSNDFDMQVLLTLQTPQPWWLALWQNSKPVVASGAFSLIVMLALISGTSKSPIQQAAPCAPLTASAPLNSIALDRILERPNLRADALIHYQAPDPVPSEISSPPPIKRDRPPLRKAYQPLSPNKRDLPFA